MAAWVIYIYIYILSHAKASKWLVAELAENHCYDSGRTCGRRFGGRHRPRSKSRALGGGLAVLSIVIAQPENCFSDQEK